MCGVRNYFPGSIELSWPTSQISLQRFVSTCVLLYFYSNCNIQQKGCFYLIPHFMCSNMRHLLLRFLRWIPWHIQIAWVFVGSSIPCRFHAACDYRLDSGLSGHAYGRPWTGTVFLRMQINLQAETRWIMLPSATTKALKCPWWVHTMTWQCLSGHFMLTWKAMKVVKELCSSAKWCLVNYEKVGHMAMIFTTPFLQGFQLHFKNDGWNLYP